MVAWLTTPGTRTFSVGQLDVSPDFPLVLVTDVAGLDRVSTNANLKQDVDDVPERQVGGMRPVPAAPADLIADPILGQTTEGVVEGFDPHHCELPVLVDAGFGIGHVPSIRKPGVVKLQH